MNTEIDLTDYILDNEDGNFVMGHEEVFPDKETFVHTVEEFIKILGADAYPDGFEIRNVRKEVCMHTDLRIPFDCVIPVSQIQGFSMAIYWCADIEVL